MSSFTLNITTPHDVKMSFDKSLRTAALRRKSLSAPMCDAPGKKNASGCTFTTSSLDSPRSLTQSVTTVSTCASSDEQSCATTVKWGSSATSTVITPETGISAVVSDTAYEKDINVHPSHSQSCAHTVSSTSASGYAYVTSFCIRELMRLQMKRCYEDGHQTGSPHVQSGDANGVDRQQRFANSVSQNNALMRSASCCPFGTHIFGRLSENFLPPIPIQEESYFFQQYFPSIIHKLQKVFKCSSSAPAVAVIYFQRLLSGPSHWVIPQNVIPVLYGVLLTLATKYLDDIQHTNVYYSACLGLELAVFNKMERDTLQRLNYRLFVQKLAFKPLSDIIGAAPYKNGIETRNTRTAGNHC